MLAVEFNTIINDGVIIVPEDYINQIGKNVRVILLKDECENIKELPDFSAVSIATKGYKFDREDANER